MDSLAAASKDAGHFSIRNEDDYGGGVAFADGTVMHLLRVLAGGDDPAAVEGRRRDELAFVLLVLRYTAAHTPTSNPRLPIPIMPHTYRSRQAQSLMPESTIPDALTPYNPLLPLRL